MKVILNKGIGFEILKRGTRLFEDDINSLKGYYTLRIIEYNNKRYLHEMKNGNIKMIIEL